MASHMQTFAEETNLAWALAEAAKPHLNTVERNDVFVAIGAGEPFAAICQLLKSIATTRIPVRPDLAQRCRMWLSAYMGHEDERYLRRLIEDFLIPCAIRVPPAVMVNERSNMPRPRRLYVYQPLRYEGKADRLRLPAIRAAAIAPQPADGPRG